MSDKDKEKDYYQNYNYNDRKPVFITEEELRPDQLDRLIKDDVFCIIPWIHLHAYPDGRAYPCCISTMENPIGNLRENTIEEVWNSNSYKGMRKNMLEGKPCKECTKCYEQEKNGFISGRNSHNKHFGHHIKLIDDTNDEIASVATTSNTNTTGSSTINSRDEQKIKSIELELTKLNILKKYSRKIILHYQSFLKIFHLQNMDF
jgi:radical SAM protein with 4Fe4S-binding SPASM domain